MDVTCLGSGAGDYAIERDRVRDDRAIQAQQPHRAGPPTCSARVYRHRRVID